MTKTEIILISIANYKFYKIYESFHGGAAFCNSNNINFKLRSDLIVNEPGSLESSFIEIIFPNKVKIFVVTFINIQI